MPKAEAGTPKAIANRIKSKGLQKLKWYCQMCQKQCRDENGFKCHMMSESHIRQMKLFVENPHQYMDHFSTKFHGDFMRLLKRRYGTRRVHVNDVYREFISDKNHLHMNSTQWKTLTEYAIYLGKNGLCEVEETPKGWFIKYVDRDPETLARQEAILRKEKLQLDEEERIQLQIEKQIEKAQQSSQPVEETVFSELQREGDESIKLELSMGKKQKTPPPVQKSVGVSIFEENQNEDLTFSTTSKDMDKKKSEIEALFEMEEKKRDKNSRKDYWMQPGIIVKILNKKLEGGKFYKMKGVVKKMRDKYVGEIQVLDTGDVISLDQAHCETVIPAIGGKVLILNGAYRNEMAELLEINTEKFSASLQIINGPFHGKVLSGIQYEDFSKIQ